MVKLVLTYDLDRYGNPSIEANYPQNLQDRKYALSGLELILKIHKKYKIGCTVFVLGKLIVINKTNSSYHRFNKIIKISKFHFLSIVD